MMEPQVTETETQSLPLVDRIKLKMGTIAIGGTMLLAQAQAAFATTTSSNIFDKGVSMMQDIYDNLIKITTPIAVVAVVVALVGTMFSHDDRKISKGRDVAKGVAVTWALILLLGYIVAYAKTWIGSGGLMTF